jgi:hypothetical protein
MCLSETHHLLALINRADHLHGIGASSPSQPGNVVLPAPPGNVAPPAPVVPVNPMATVDRVVIPAALPDTAAVPVGGLPRALAPHGVCQPVHAVQLMVVDQSVVLCEALAEHPQESATTSWQQCSYIALSTDLFKALKAFGPIKRLAVDREMHSILSWKLVVPNLFSFSCLIATCAGYAMQGSLPLQVAFKKSLFNSPLSTYNAD